MSARLKVAVAGAVSLAGGEERARAAYEAAVGRSLSDTEWEETRAKLINFTKILRNWEKNATSER
jgi:hypothetical protein